MSDNGANWAMHRAVYFVQPYFSGSDMCVDNKRHCSSLFFLVRDELRGEALFLSQGLKYSLDFFTSHCSLPWAVRRQMASVLTVIER